MQLCNAGYAFISCFRRATANPLKNVWHLGRVVRFLCLLRMRERSGRRYPARYPLGHNKLKLLAQLDYKQAAPGTGGAPPLPPGILLRTANVAAGKIRATMPLRCGAASTFVFDRRASMCPRFCNHSANLKNNKVKNKKNHFRKNTSTFDADLFCGGAALLLCREKTPSLNRGFCCAPRAKMIYTSSRTYGSGCRNSTRSINAKAQQTGHGVDADLTGSSLPTFHIRDASATSSPLWNGHGNAKDSYQDFPRARFLSDRRPVPKDSTRRA